MVLVEMGNLAYEIGICISVRTTHTNAQAPLPLRLPPRSAGESLPPHPPALAGHSAPRYRRRALGTSAEGKGDERTSAEVVQFNTLNQRKVDDLVLVRGGKELHGQPSMRQWAAAGLAAQSRKKKLAGDSSHFLDCVARGDASISV